MHVCNLNFHVIFTSFTYLFERNNLVIRSINFKYIQITKTWYLWLVYIRKRKQGDREQENVKEEATEDVLFQHSSKYNNKR